MYRFLLVVLFVAGTSGLTLAQKKKAAGGNAKFHHAVSLGYHIGGLAPTSFPNTIRKIESFSPGLSPSVAYAVRYDLGEHWSVGSGLGLDFKSMSIRDQVQYFHTLVSIDNSSIEGDFSGINTTRVRNVYLTLPVHAMYRTQNGWQFQLGAYFAQLLHPSFSGSVTDGYLRKGNSLGEKITIDHASFDFSQQQRTFDFGVQGGAEKRVYKKLYVKANLDWGLRPVFPESFTGISFRMYNIFANFGVSYHL